MSHAVTRADVEAAHARIRHHVRHTPVMEVEAGVFGTKEPVSLKLELLQHAGSFKPRGAFNTLLSSGPPAGRVGAASGGNHGVAVAYAAARLGRSARIFVPTIASPVKVARIRAEGAEVVVGGDRYADALAACDAWAASEDALTVHAYDAAATMAGQGTVALEWSADAALDTVLVAAGGGGLVAGMAAYFARGVRVVAVEPEDSRCVHAALEAGAPVDVSVSGVAADSLGARRVGELVLPIVRDLVERVVLVSDAAIGAAQARIWRELHLAAEPGGAAAAAALWSGAYRPERDERVGVLVCGSNVDLAKLASLSAV